MANQLRTQRLFRSPLLTIREVHCHQFDCCRGPEEVSHTNDVVIPRRGLFVIHQRGKRTVADPNQIVFFHRDEPYRVSHPIDGGDACIVFSFAPEVLAEAFAEHPLRRQAADPLFRPFPCDVAPGGSAPFVWQFVLARFLTEADPDPLAVEESSMRLLSAIAAAGRAATGASNGGGREDTLQAHRGLTEHVQTILSESVGERVALDELSRKVHASAYHLARVFRRVTGLPIHRYQTRLRLRASLEPLADGCRDFSSLALSLGFSSHSHFTDAFRREFGLTPSDFRGRSSSLLREMNKGLNCPVAGSVA